LTSGRFAFICAHSRISGLFQGRQPDRRSATPISNPRRPHSFYASTPIVTIGKYFEHGRKLLLPLAIQVHHGIVDGIHIGRFIKRLGRILSDPDGMKRPGSAPDGV
jgi:hypothetical protein